MIKRKQITLRVLSETDEKLVRLADDKLLSKGVIIDELIKKAKEPQT